eukprot:TRINITY_DN32396_c0_g1_i1.p1 TRINITY_DN32396_c0_g1~~TRINITY_DN32396_c0_g1_i1.p1  ORF type:complete len:627 (+),score=137.00 TRINITY_DN32396_c0_g1_i1:60-1940(+)
MATSDGAPSKGGSGRLGEVKSFMSGSSNSSRMRSKTQVEEFAGLYDQGQAPVAAKKDWKGWDELREMQSKNGDGVCDEVEREMTREFPEVVSDDGEVTVMNSPADTNLGSSGSLRELQRARDMAAKAVEEEADEEKKSQLEAVLQDAIAAYDHAVKRAKRQPPPVRPFNVAAKETEAQRRRNEALASDTGSSKRHSSPARAFDVASKETEAQRLRNMMQDAGPKRTSSPPNRPFNVAKKDTEAQYWRGVATQQLFYRNHTAGVELSLDTSTEGRVVDGGRERSPRRRHYSSTTHHPPAHTLVNESPDDPEGLAFARQKSASEVSNMSRRLHGTHTRSSRAKAVPSTRRPLSCAQSSPNRSSRRSLTSTHASPASVATPEHLPRSSPRHRRMSLSGKPQGATRTGLYDVIDDEAEPDTPAWDIYEYKSTSPTASRQDRSSRHNSPRSHRSRSRSSADGDRLYTFNRECHSETEVLLAMHARAVREGPAFELLDTAVEDDEAAFLLLGAAAYGGLGPHRGAAQHVPERLRSQNAIPSSLNAMQHTSPQYAAGLAKLLHMLTEPTAKSARSPPDASAPRVVKRAAQRREEHGTHISRADYHVALTVLRTVRQGQGRISKPLLRNSAVRR